MRKFLMMLMPIVVAISCNKVENTDVLIIGGGASGVSAGLQAARMGVNAVILEETPWLGGMLTSAGVSCVDGNYKLRSGIFGEFTDSLAARYGGYPSLQTGWVSNINFDPQVGQEIFTSMTEAESACLTVKRNVVWKSVRTRGDRKEVVFLDEDGKERRISAKVLIDATELGDVAKACGAEYRIGMDSSSETGESIAPEQANDVIQDMTFVAFLKDYGPDADMTIDRPEGYDPSLFADSCLNPLSDGVAETGQTVWSPEMMITYGRTPGGRYMINWPIYGNDWYANVIDASPEEREAAYDDARNFTLCFVYFIQTHLGMKNLGLADDVFPTDDRLPFFPYHRESRRIRGEAFLTMDAVAKPYDYEKPYYRTGIAVGDYPVDHHHFRHPQWRSLPDLHFYPVPSFNVPLGVVIPEGHEGLLVAEKSVSVSNLINGATRLQPVVMQLGQASGALAALAVKDGCKIREVGVRDVQSVLLEEGCYLMPYLDLPADHPHFKALQRMGATGILRGEGRNVGWENQTWFRAEDPLLAQEIYAAGFCNGDFGHGFVSVGSLLDAVRGLGGEIPSDCMEWWKGLGLEDYELSRNATRLEAAVVIDAVFKPFEMCDVDYEGRLLPVR